MYCESCKHEKKKIASQKYEHSIRQLYDELKENIDKCNPELANKIKNLKAKDKVKKSELKELYSEYKKNLETIK